MNSSQAPGENLKENSPVLCFTFFIESLLSQHITDLVFSVMCHLLINESTHAVDFIRRSQCLLQIISPSLSRFLTDERYEHSFEEEHWCGSQTCTEHRNTHTHPLIFLVLLTVRHVFCFPLSLSGGESGWLCGCSTCKWSPCVNRLQLPHQLPLFY